MTFSETFGDFFSLLNQRAARQSLGNRFPSWMDQDYRSFLRHGTARDVSPLSRKQPPWWSFFPFLRKHFDRGQIRFPYSPSTHFPFPRNGFSMKEKSPPPLPLQRPRYGETIAPLLAYEGIFEHVPFFLIYDPHKLSSKMVNGQGEKASSAGVLFCHTDLHFLPFERIWASFYWGLAMRCLSDNW